MPRLTCTVFALALVAICVAAQPTADDIAGLIEADPISQRMSIGVHVIDAETGEVLFDHFGDHLFTPASNVKLYTSACALATWGADHTFQTVVGLHGELAGRRLEGDLILSGDGDPCLTSENLQAIAQRVRDELGIETIAGDVVIDDSRIAPRRKGPGWMWDDDPDEYNMSIASLMLDYNVLTVEVTDGQAALVPPSDFPPIETGPSESGTTSIDRQPFSDVIQVTGSGSASDTLTMHDPSPWIGGVFRRMIEDAGVEVEGDVRVVTEAPAFEVALTHESLPLSEILALFNKPSENAIGEMLIHAFAPETGDGPATWRAGAAELTRWLTEEAGVDAGGFRLVDGSGLSRYDLICASGTVQLLRHMRSRPDFDVYVASLPDAGADGTLRTRMSGTAAEGRIQAKTGTMSGVSCLSGYATTVSGRELIFSILTNGYIGSSAPSRDLQDLLCAAICEIE